MNYPSYNIDKSGNLLIELTCDLDFSPDKYLTANNKKRKLIFYNNEGRGIIDEINDVYEKNIELRRAITRFFSTSTAIKEKYSSEYSHLLNFEYSEGNLELFNLKTGESSVSDLFTVFEISKYNFGGISNTPIMFLLESNKENQYLFIYLLNLRDDEEYRIITFLIFEFNPLKDKYSDIYSLKDVKIENLLGDDIDKRSRIFCTQTKNGFFILDAMLLDSYLHSWVIDSSLENWFMQENGYKQNIEDFHKRVFLKDEISLLCYSPYEFANQYILSLLIQELKNNVLINLSSFNLSNEKYEGINKFYTDIISFTETRVIILALKYHRKMISIYIIDLFDDYNNYLIEKFNVNIMNQKMEVSTFYSFIFKYKDLLGLQFRNMEGKNGFILFGYFNSTDPKQIYDIKKDGLNYNITLKDYLFVQSNVFEYEIKGIKIISVPNQETSGLYLISNKLNNFIKENDTIDIDTEISLYFTYNGILKKDNYLFKIAGILQEPSFENIENYFDDIIWSKNETGLEDKYKSIYNERRNMNIIGKVSLVQINVFNDIKVFCDKIYDDTCIKSIENICITCGKGTFYNVKNENEITQMNLGLNYYFDINNNAYIKCHPRCKTCSKEYNKENMNCDSCYNNFYIRNNTCLETSYCENNYFYDNDFNLKCVIKQSHALILSHMK